MGLDVSLVSKPPQIHVYLRSPCILERRHVFPTVGAQFDIQEFRPRALSSNAHRPLIVKGRSVVDHVPMYPLFMAWWQHGIKVHGPRGPSDLHCTDVGIRLPRVSRTSSHWNNVRLRYEHNPGIRRLFGFNSCYLRRTTPGFIFICYNKRDTSACTICFRPPPGTKHCEEGSFDPVASLGLPLLCLCRTEWRCAMYLTCVAGNVACCMAVLANEAPGCLR
ncbi:hypothetical protein BDW71DRAFT_12407 [Aspergillus fruticulosus]